MVVRCEVGSTGRAARGTWAGHRGAGAAHRGPVAVEAADCWGRSAYCSSERAAQRDLTTTMVLPSGNDVVLRSHGVRAGTADGARERAPDRGGRGAAVVAPPAVRTLPARVAAVHPGPPGTCHPMSGSSADRAPP